MFRSIGMLLAIAVLATPALAPPDDAAHRRAAARLAHLLDEPIDEITLLHHRRLELIVDREPRRVTVFKYVDKSTGRIRRLAIDADGNEIDDLPRLQRASREHERGSRQKLGRSLFDRLDKAPDDDDERYPVLLQMRAPPPPGPPKLREGEDRAAAKRRQDREHRSAVRTVYDGLVRKNPILAAKPVDRDAGRDQPMQPRRIGPFVQASLTRDEIRALAEQREIVEIMQIERTDTDDVIDDGEIGVPLADARVATRTNRAHAVNVQGTGVRVAILEPGGPLDVACFRIDAGEHIQDAANTRPSHEQLDDVAHGTKSAAMIGNTLGEGDCNGEREGYAPLASLSLANSEAIDATYLAIACEFVTDVQADIISMSFQMTTDPAQGTWSDRDVLFDALVAEEPYPLVIASAGRSKRFSRVAGEYVAAKGYNILSVADVLLDGDDDRSNDTLSEISPWQDPTSEHGDRELPSIAAPGSTHRVYGTTYAGTSAATQVVAGIAALVLAKAPAEARDYPEAMRAILQASADATPKDDTPWSCDASYDGKHGVGVINARRAVEIVKTREPSDAARTHAYDFGWIGVADEPEFTDGVLKRSWTIDVPSDGATIRVALAWLNLPLNEDDTWDTLHSNLDLLVYRAGQDKNPEGSSTSVDESYELVELKADAGQYLIKVHADDPDEIKTRFGVAWTVVDAELP